MSRGLAPGDAHLDVVEQMQQLSGSLVTGDLQQAWPGLSS